MLENPHFRILRSWGPGYLIIYSSILPFPSRSAKHSLSASEGMFPPRGPWLQMLFLVFPPNHRSLSSSCTGPGSAFWNKSLLVHFNYKLPKGALLTEGNRALNSGEPTVGVQNAASELSHNFLSESKGKITLQWRAVGPRLTEVFAVFNTGLCQAFILMTLRYVFWYANLRKILLEKKKTLLLA